MMLFSSAKAQYHYLPAVLVISCVDCRLDLQADLIMPAIKESYLAPSHIHTTTNYEYRCSKALQSIPLCSYSPVLPHILVKRASVLASIPPLHDPLYAVTEEASCIE